MKTILIIEDTPDKPGELDIHVMRIQTPNKYALGTGEYDTLASMYMLVLEGVLYDTIKKVKAGNMALMAKKTPVPDQEPSKCLH